MYSQIKHINIFMNFSNIKFLFGSIFALISEIFSRLVDVPVDCGMHFMSVLFRRKRIKHKTSVWECKYHVLLRRNRGPFHLREQKPTNWICKIILLRQIIEFLSFLTAFILLRVFFVKFTPLNSTETCIYKIFTLKRSKHHSAVLSTIPLIFILDSKNFFTESYTRWELILIDNIELRKQTNL